MRDWLKRNRKSAIAAGLFFVSGFAWAFPWDIDMVNGVAFKGYEWKMRPIFAEGAVQRDGAATVPGAVQRSSGPGGFQGDYVAPAKDVDQDALVNPYADNAANGEKLFQMSCAPCHGVGGAGGGPVMYNDAAKGIKRYPGAAAILSGTGSVVPSRTDGHIYATIRYGRNTMPSYGISLTDRERWAIVSYLRSLEGNAQAAPAPADAPATDSAAGGTAQ
jgi:mono/diheme cytochrome c family protein